MNNERKLSLGLVGLSAFFVCIGAWEDLRNANNTWNAGQAVTPVALTDGSTIAVNAALSNGFTVTLTGNSHQLSTPTGLITGQTINVAVKNGTTAGFSGFNTTSSYSFPGGTQPTWSASAGLTDVISCWATGSATLHCAALIND